MTTISPDRIRAIEARRDELQALMSTGDLPSDRFVAVSKEYAELEPVAQAATEVRRLRQEAESLAFMAEDADDELRAMASDERDEISVVPSSIRAAWKTPSRSSTMRTSVSVWPSPSMTFFMRSWVSGRGGSMPCWA